MQSTTLSGIVLGLVLVVPAQAASLSLVGKWNISYKFSSGATYTDTLTIYTETNAGKFFGIDQYGMDIVGIRKKNLACGTTLSLPLLEDGTGLTQSWCWTVGTPSAKKEAGYIGTFTTDTEIQSIPVPATITGAPEGDRHRSFASSEERARALYRELKEQSSANQTGQ